MSRFGWKVKTVGNYIRERWSEPAGDPIFF